MHHINKVRDMKYTILSIFLLAMAWENAFADNITCKSCSDSINNNGALVVDYDIVGLGNTAEAGWILTADVSGHARCKNQGGNCPNADNKFGLVNLSSQGTLSVHNGRARGSVLLSPATGLNCPGNQQPVILDVEWTNIRLEVEGVVVFTDTLGEQKVLVSCQK